MHAAYRDWHAWVIYRDCLCPGSWVCVCVCVCAFQHCCYSIQSLRVEIVLPELAMWYTNFKYYIFVQSQQQKEKNIVKPPVQLDGDKLFDAIHTSRPVQSSWGTGPLAHPWIDPLPCCNTTNYNHYHLLWLLYNREASEDVGEICPPTDDVSMMVPLPASEVTQAHSVVTFLTAVLSLQSQEAFSISLDVNNDEVDDQWILYQCIISSITESKRSRYASTCCRVSDMFQWEGAVDIHTMWSRDLSAV